MTNILNFTPHALNVVDLDGNVTTFPSVGIARVATSVKALDPVCGFDVVSTTFSDVTGLPDYDPDKYYVVSRLVLSACPDRADLMCPGELIRDADGNVVGCKGFSL